MLIVVNIGQGFRNVGSWAATLIHESVGKVIAVSDIARIQVQQPE